MTLWCLATLEHLTLGVSDWGGSDKVAGISLGCAAPRSRGWQAWRENGCCVFGETLKRIARDGASAFLIKILGWQGPLGALSTSAGYSTTGALTRSAQRLPQCCLIARAAPLGEVSERPAGSSDPATHLFPRTGGRPWCPAKADALVLPSAVDEGLVDVIQSVRQHLERLAQDPFGEGHTYEAYPPMLPTRKGSSCAPPTLRWRRRNSGSLGLARAVASTRRRYWAGMTTTRTSGASRSPMNRRRRAIQASRTGIGRLAGFIR